MPSGEVSEPQAVSVDVSTGSGPSHDRRVTSSQPAAEASEAQPPAHRAPAEAAAVDDAARHDDAVAVLESPRKHGIDKSKVPAPTTPVLSGVTAKQVETPRIKLPSVEP